MSAVAPGDGGDMKGLLTWAIHLCKSIIREGEYPTPYTAEQMRCG